MSTATPSPLLQMVVSVAFACVLLAAPASATADECEVPRWDGASRTVTHHIRSIDAYSSISPYFRDGSFYACWTSYPDADRIVINSDKALDISLGTVALQSLLRGGTNETKLEIDLIKPNHAPRISLDVGDWPAQIPLTIRIGQDGLDINGDGDVDVTLRVPAVRDLAYSPPSSDEDILLDGRGSAFRYRAIAVASPDPQPVGRSYFVASPRGAVGVQGGTGPDTITLIGATGGANGSGGNDLIDARAVTSGGYYAGEAGNDRLFLGPGADVINERERSRGDDFYDTGAGDDQVWTFAGSDRVITGAGNDKIVTIAQKNERMAVNTGAGHDEFTDFSTRHPGLTIVNLGAGNDRSRIFGQLPKYWLATRVNCGPGRDHYQAWGRNKWTRGCEIFVT